LAISKYERIHKAEFVRHGTSCSFYFLRMLISMSAFLKFMAAVAAYFVLKFHCEIGGIRGDLHFNEH